MNSNNNILAARAAQPEGQGLSLAEVDELCAEFGFHLDDDREESLEILQEMIDAVLARWGNPATPPDVAFDDTFTVPVDEPKEPNVKAVQSGNFADSAT